MLWWVLIPSLVLAAVCVTWKCAKRVYDRRVKELKDRYSAAYHRVLGGEENER